MTNNQSRKYKLKGFTFVSLVIWKMSVLNKTKTMYFFKLYKK